MEKVRKGFQIIDGFRHCLPNSKPTRSDQNSLPHQGGDFPYDQLSEPTKDGLTGALKAAEHRLCTLLEDRTRIGRDLHDCVLQSLYAIGLNLEASRRETSHQTLKAQQSSDRVVKQLNQLIHEIRRMIRGLEAGTIQEFDLALEILTLRASYQQLDRLQVMLDLQPDALEVLTNEEEQEILSIVREALSNCVRHANATQATISIRMRGTRIRVRINDDGIGFLQTDGQPRGYGLANMDARARKLGGTLRVQSKIGRGTHIIVEFSLEPILAPV